MAHGCSAIGVPYPLRVHMYDYPHAPVHEFLRREFFAQEKYAIKRMCYETSALVHMWLRIVTQKKPPHAFARMRGLCAYVLIGRIEARGVLCR